ncbi:UNVERIFIED_CONTAM: SAL1 phosphatase [Sesamum angustifolium]|uniref:SAL1 phosphatase n=1 Tax=Sesamum angustifolium TaxID=2727405 RepID=A0AAW2NIB1_9LAMI
MNASIGLGHYAPLTRGVLLHISPTTTPPNSQSKIPFLFSLSPSLSTTTTQLRAVRGRRVAASMSYDKQLAAAKKAASLSARLCQKVQKALLQSDVQSKSDKSPVTVADYGSQALISFILEKEFPSVPFSLVAEEDSGDLRKEESGEALHRITELVNETLATDGMNDISPLSEEDVLKAIDNGKSEGGPHGQHWVLDPIDGTKGFLRGDQYAIALALLDEGKVVLGVLACPNLPLASIARGDQSISGDGVGALFFAQVEAGTYMQSLDGSTPTKVHVTAIENPEEASFFESYEAAHSSHDLSGLIARKLGVKAPPVRIDSQAKYGALSRGDGAIYMRFPRKGYREKIWDHAAGYIVVAEAGGVATDAAGNPLDFSKGRYLDLDTGIIVTNQKLMPSLLKAVQESIKEKASSL